MKYQNIQSYKYRVFERVQYTLPFHTHVTYSCKWFKLNDNILTVYKGYCWNGSNLVRDTKADMEASLVHDIICQLIKLKILPLEPFLNLANTLYYQMCINGKMSPFRANMRLLGLKLGSKKSVLLGKEENPVIEV